MDEAGIGDLILEIATRWPAYREGRKVSAKADVYRLVTRDFPEVMRQSLSNLPGLKFEGSTGAGNITAAPWVATFDPRVTTSATRGYYVVYLFSVDLKRVYLSLAFGTTQFRQQFGASQAPRKMRLAAGKLHRLFSGLSEAQGLTKEPIDLAASPRTWLHLEYEQAVVFSLPPYSLADLPTEARLQADYRRMVILYQALLEDPTCPTLEDLALSTVQAPPQMVPIVKDFALRALARHGRGASSVAVHPRRSMASLKIGRAGEGLVFATERRRLVDAGRPDLANRVEWLARDGKTPGWDISSFQPDGRQIRIEVKSSISRTVSSLEVTAKEWAVATDPNSPIEYWIYIVTDLFSIQPVIERLRSPSDLVVAGSLVVAPSVYELRLTAMAATVESITD